MDIRLSAKHMQLTPSIEEYATKKVERFSRYLDLVTHVEVVVAKEKNSYDLEIITDVASHHEPFVAHAQHEDLYASIDLCVDRSIRQLTDYKSRLRDNKSHESMRGTET